MLNNMSAPDIEAGNVVRLLIRVISPGEAMTVSLTAPRLLVVFKRAGIGPSECHIPRLEQQPGLESHKGVVVAGCRVVATHRTRAVGRIG